ncbi:hypothetical protein [Paenibacillus sp. FSL P4-0288]|uniref:hypothetical protein n=1 Tax=Paenibacillus sp. FSL P4-0288 TaxID=2921633 RepID=UPI0030F57C0A
MAFVIVIRDVGNPHADFYAGGTYQCEREIYPVTALGDMDAKKYRTRKMAERAADGLDKRTRFICTVVELPE